MLPQSLAIQLTGCPCSGTPRGCVWVQGLVALEPHWAEPEQLRTPLSASCGEVARGDVTRVLRERELFMFFLFISSL